MRTTETGNVDILRHYHHRKLSLEQGTFLLLRRHSRHLPRSTPVDKVLENHASSELRVKVRKGVWLFLQYADGSFNDADMYTDHTRERLW